MRVQHNIMAMNAYRNYTANNSALSKNLEKLSSGYKINRAGDDAAGLAISEKMRAQITGLETAQKNAKDGISLVQTAEGALTEVHDMLNRMVELADQSANGTFDNENDRAQLQKEVDALREEINRIADSSNFNGIKLLDGSLSGSNDLGALGLQDTTATKASTTATALAATNPENLAKGDTISYTVSWKENGQEYSKNITLTVKEDENTPGNLNLVADNGTIYNGTDNSGKEIALADITGAIKNELIKDSKVSSSLKVTEAGNVFTFEAKTAGKDGATITSIGFTTSNATAGLSGGNINTSTAGVDAMKKLDFSKVGVADFKTKAVSAADIEKNIFEIDGKKFLLGTAAAAGSAGNMENVPDDVTVITVSSTTLTANDYKDIAEEISRVTGKEFEHQAAVGPTGSGISANDILYKGTDSLGGTKGGMTLQIGDSSDDYNQLNFTVKDIHANALGIAGIDISTQEGAKAADSVLKKAINTISDIRGGLGAIQNRLDHTINNLGVMTENIQDAESTIRDTDVADEMMAYTKNNILVQSAQAMLAQANQVPQGVLQLLQ